MNRIVMRAFTCVVVLAASMGAGYLFSEWQARTVSPSGYCCMQGGSDCSQGTTMDACTDQGGLMFDVSQQNCSNICRTLPPS